MPRDDVGALSWVVGGEDGLDLREWNVELPESVNDLGSGDLLWCVVPVAGGGVHRVRLEKPRRVIAPQRPHAQAGERRELTDAET